MTGAVFICHQPGINIMFCSELCSPGSLQVALSYQLMVGYTQTVDLLLLDDSDIHVVNC